MKKINTFTYSFFVLDWKLYILYSYVYVEKIVHKLLG